MTAALGGFLGSLATAELPSSVRAAVAQQTLEIFTGLFAGADVVEMQPVLHAYGRAAGRVAIPATAIGSEVALAAGATAALAHAAELDPIHAGTVICPAAVTIPAALALSQTTTLTGRRYVAAICAGYEAGIRLGRTLDGAALLAAGWWPTAVCGSFAAAATSAVCLGLDSERLQDALGLAAILSGGLAIGGPNTAGARNLLCAQTVRIGVEAALAAQAGICGPRELFTGARNILTAFGRGAIDPARAADATAIDTGLGDNWAVLETSLKRWPCALQAQSALDALLRVVGNLDAAARSSPTAAPAAIARLPQSVEIRLPAAMCRIVDRPGPPATQWAAAASLQFLAASVLLDGDLRAERMSPAGRADARVLELMQRIHLGSDPSLDERYPREWPARVILRDPLAGSPAELTAESAQPPGHPSRPLTFEFSAARFHRYAEARLPSHAIDSAVEFVRRLEEQPDMAAAVALLRPQTASAP